MSKFIIRPEQPGDIEAITRVNTLAFEAHPHSEQTEHLIVNALRSAGALSISLVAERSNQVIGHIAFSPVQLSDGSTHWYGLGPVAVLPALQHQGIGKALIHSGLAALQALGAAGCVVLGDPNYYGRFGFKSRPDCVFEGVPAEYFQSLTFGAHSAMGAVTYHDAFNTKR